jgi:hypothetical protein
MAAFYNFTFIEPGATPTQADSLVAEVPYRTCLYSLGLAQR